MRQGNDVGTQYRSAVYTYEVAGAAARAEASRDPAIRSGLTRCRTPDVITTEIREAPPCYFAEDYHQQNLAKNPCGLGGLGGTGVSPARLGHLATAAEIDEQAVPL